MSIDITLADSTASHIAAALRTNAETDLTSLNGGLQQMLERVQQESATSEEAEKKAEVLQSKWEQYDRVIRKARDRLDLLAAKGQVKRSLWQNEVRRAATSSELVRNLRHRIDQTNREVVSLRAQLEDAALLNRQAEMLMSVSEYIDQGYPIQITSSETEVRCSWRTRDIYLSDGFGGTLPHCFGRYEVTVTKVVGAAVSRVHVMCSHLGGSVLADTSYPHPHISGNNPCLGNAQELLLTAINERDFVRIVVVMNEFLTSYNHENPYRKLVDAGIYNRWESPVCETDQHLLINCTCARCPECGVRLTPNIITYDCGVCSSCCHHNHLHEPMAEELKSGINGTGCTPRNAPRHIYRIKLNQTGGSDEGNGQENADVHQDGVGQDVGPHVEVQG